MSQKQWKRLEVVERVGRGELTMWEAALVLGISRRQMVRLRKAVEKYGKAAVRHGNAGRSPWNRQDELTRERVVNLFQTKYEGFNDTHFTEKLVEEERGMKVSRATVQRWLRAARLAPARKRRPAKHRRRREPQPNAGMLVLWDGSPHDWLEGRGPRLCLMGAVDDATGTWLPGAHFVEQECSAAYLRLLRELCREVGIPLAMYMDKHSSLRRNDGQWSLEEELRGEQDPTQVGRAMRELGIEIIYANSPQAKGRVERPWGTHQDRLVSELRLIKAKTITEANEVLARYRPDYNRHFARPPADARPVWRKVPASVDLDRVCSFYYQATVGNDNAVRLEGGVIDIPPGPCGRGYARARVEVRQLLDGSWRIYHHGRLIAITPSTTIGELRAKKQRKRSAASRAFRAGIERLAVSLP